MYWLAVGNDIFCTAPVTAADGVCCFGNCCMCFGPRMLCCTAADFAGLCCKSACGQQQLLLLLS